MKYEFKISLVAFLAVLGMAAFALFGSLVLFPGAAYAGPFQTAVGGTGNAGTFTGVVKANTTSPYTQAANGTDYTLVTALTCGAGNHFSATTAAGVFTCSADTGSGGTGLSTTSPISAGNILVYSSGGAGSAFGIATGTVSAGSSAITVTAGRSAIGGALAIDCAVASGTQAGCLSIADWVTHTTNRLSTSSALVQGQILYGTGGAAGQTVASVATTSLGVTGPITFSGTPGAQIGGGAGSFGCTTATGAVAGCLASADWLTFNNKVATATVPTQGQLSYWSGVGTPSTLASVATGTVSAGSSAITVTAGRSVVGGALAIDCATATSGQNGCLSSTDWSTFNNKTSWPFTINAATVNYGQASQSTTTEVHFGATGYSLTASSTSAFDQITVGSTSNSLMATSTFNASLLVKGTVQFANQEIVRLTNSTRVQFEDADGNNSDWSFRVAAGGFGTINFGGSQGTLAAPTVTAVGNGLGELDAYGYTGTAYAKSASIKFLNHATSSTLSMPGLITFSTAKPNTLNTMFESMRIDSAQRVVIGTTSPAANSLETLATSTGQHITLADGNNSPWAIRATGGNLYFSTSSIVAATSATTTIPAITILGSSGYMGIGSSSPFAFFSLNAPGGVPSYFAIGSTSGSTVFNVIPSANSSLLIGTTTPTAANTSATSTIYMQKLQFQGGNSAGNTYCTYVNVAGAWSVDVGPCK